MREVVGEGVTIRWTAEGDGPPIALLHGFADGIEGWADFGWVAALARRFRVIRFDARGHGRSARPRDPAAYSLETQAGDFGAVLDAARAPTAHVVGFSMGAWIALATAALAPARLRSLVAIGVNPFSGAASSRARAGPRAAVEHGPDAIADLWSEAGPGSAERRGRLLANDPLALLAALACDAPRPPIEAVLAAPPFPCLFLAGDRDPAHPGLAESLQGRPNVEFASLAGLRHVETFGRRDAVLPHVVRFIGRAEGSRDGDRL